jgi:hypothetical protein
MFLDSSDHVKKKGMAAVLRITCFGQIYRQQTLVKVLDKYCEVGKNFAKAFINISAIAMMLLLCRLFWLLFKNPEDILFYLLFSLI